MILLVVCRYNLRLCIILYTVNLISSVLTFMNENDQYTKDKIAFQVINDLHSEMDINKDGEINSNEAEEFAQGEVKLKSTLGISNKIKTHLTKDLLWKSWRSSKAYNWTVDDTVTWLTLEVELPEYTNIFIKNNINGSMIPRLALSDTSFLLNTLGIRNEIHRRRIAIRSKDLILFGPSKDLSTTWKETEAYDVIKSLHSQLDDDKDGGVDPNEANEFARDELKYTADFDRPKRFSKNDNHISKEELWKNWKSSAVYNWTLDDVIDWLKIHVELSEYMDLFKLYKIDGPTIPRLAATDMSFLIKELKIKNPVHRKKLVVKATDLILFGPPKKIYSFMKDSILFTLIFITIGGCWLAYFQHRYSKNQLKSMQDKLNQLGVAEDSLLKLQTKLFEAEEQNSRVNSEKQKIEEKLKSEYEKLKEEISRDSMDDLFKYKHGDEDMLNLDIIQPEQLKILLQMNYEIEENFFNYKKKAAYQQMQNVKDMCEKLRKKKSTLIGSLRIAHSGNLDDMDKELSEAKNAVDEVRNDLVERSQRWDYIEKLTKFKLIPTPGLVSLRSAFTATLNGVYRRAKNHTNRLSSSYDDSLSENESGKAFKQSNVDTNDESCQSNIKVNQIGPFVQTKRKTKGSHHRLKSYGSTKLISDFNDNDTDLTSVHKYQHVFNREALFNSTDSLDRMSRNSQDSKKDDHKKHETRIHKKSKLSKTHQSLGNLITRGN